MSSPNAGHPAARSPLAKALAHDTYVVRAKILSLLGQKFHVYNDAGDVVLYCKMKAFKLKEDIQLFASEAEQTPLLKIAARSVIDFSASYDVVDLAAGGVKVGALRRKGMKSLLRDAWEMLDEDDNVIATIQEDSTFKALVRRFVEAAAFLMPQKYHGEIAGRQLFSFEQNFNPFVRKLKCDFTPDTGGEVDRRLGMAAAILLMAIEGKQN